MSRLYKNGGRIGKTVDYGSTDTYTTGSTNKKNSGIWNLDSAIKAEPPGSYDSLTTSTTDEGASVDWTLTTSNVPAGTTVGWTIAGTATNNGAVVGTDIQAADFGTRYNGTSFQSGDYITFPGYGGRMIGGLQIIDSSGTWILRREQSPLPQGFSAEELAGMIMSDTSLAISVYHSGGTYSTNISYSVQYSENTHILIPDILAWLQSNYAVTLTGVTAILFSGSRKSATLTYDYIVPFSSLTGTATIDASGTTLIPIAYVADSRTEAGAVEEYTLTLDSTDSLGNSTGSLSNYGYINDTSKAVSFSIPAWASSINEGDTTNIQLDVYNSTQTMYWTIDGTTSDFNAVSGSTTYSSTYSSGNDTVYVHSISITAKNDGSSEASGYAIGDTFTLSVRTGSTSGPVVETAGPIGVYDTSKTLLYGVYATSDTTPDEGTTPWVDFYVTNTSPTMYWSIDSGTSDFDTASGSVNYYTTSAGYPTAIPYDTAYIYRVNLSVTADDTTEGNENHTIRFRSGSTSGTIQASQTLTVQDTSQDPPPPAAGGDPELSGVLLTRSGQYSTTSWENNISIDLSSYVGSTGRLVFYYESNTSFRGDLQLDNINLNGTTYTFTSSNDGFETTSVDTNSIGSETTAHYESLSFSSVPTSTNGYAWNRDAGGTPSSSTGLTVDASGSSTGYYLYPETSITHPASYWLRSPEVTLTTGTCSISCARYGSNIGTLKVYWYGTPPGPATVEYDLVTSTTPTGLTYNPSQSTLLSAFSATYGYQTAGDAGTGSVYELYTTDALDGDYLFECTVLFTDRCSDPAIAIWDSGTPVWAWGTSSTRISFQSNCQTPYLYGTSASASTNGSVAYAAGKYITLHLHHQPSLSRTRAWATNAADDWGNESTNLIGSIASIANYYTNPVYCGLASDFDNASLGAASTNFTKLRITPG